MPYNPQDDAIVVSKPFGALGFNIDARSTYYDKSTYTRRPFTSTAEVLAYFDTAFKRQGNFTILVDDGSGITKYWFKNGVADSDLVLENTGGSGGSTDWSDITNKPTFIAAGSTEANARAAIGAGTSNLTLGVTSTTAKAGDYTPSISDVTGLNTALATKVDKDGTKVLSDVNFSTAKDTKLNGIASGAQVNAIDSITTTGSTGAATLIDKVLNIPQYSGGGGGGGVDSVGLTAPTGFDVSNSPITSSGNIALAFASGYSLPTTAKQTTWDGKQDALTAGANITIIDDVISATGGGGEEYPIHAWGDSMTDGTGSTGNGNYPYQLTDILGKKVIKHGFPGYTSTQIKDEFIAYYTANPLEKQNPAIIWVGRNNYYPSTTQVKADIAEMVAVLGHNRYLLLGITNSNPAEQIGNDGYNVIVAYNAEMQNLYKTSFIDIRRELVLNYNPSIPQDVTDFGLDLPPSSLLSDNIHLNNAGYLVVAKRIAKSSDVLYGQGDKFSGDLKIIQGNKIPNGRGIELNTIGDTGYLSNYDRLKDLPEKLSIQYNAGSELTLLENGGVLKLGTLASYTSGELLLPVIDVSTRQVKQNSLGDIIPNPLNNNISITNGVKKIIGGDITLDLADTIQINRGIIVNGNSYHISPSSTRGVFQLSGSTDRFLLFGAGDAYILSSATITQILSTPDLQFVAGGAEGMKIDTSQQVTVEKAPITAKGVVRKQELDLKANIDNPTFTTKITTPKIELSSLNTAPSSSTDTGTLGEIRVTADYIYVCTATNTWVRSQLSTW